MCAALGIIGGSTRIKTMVVITKRSELVETRHAVGERWNVEEPNAGDLALAIDIEKQVPAYPHRARLTSLSKLEVDDSLAGVRVPLVLHLGRRAIRWLELHGDVHVWLSLSVANLDGLSCERVVQNERTVSFFQTLTRRFVSSRAANAIFKSGAAVLRYSPRSHPLAARSRIALALIHSPSSHPSNRTLPWIADHSCRHSRCSVWGQP